MTWIVEEMAKLILIIAVYRNSKLYFFFKQTKQNLETILLLSHSLFLVMGKDHAIKVILSLGLIALRAKKKKRPLPFFGSF